MSRRGVLAPSRADEGEHQLIVEAFRIPSPSMEETLQGAAGAKEIRQRAGELYRDAIARIVQGLERNG